VAWVPFVLFGVAVAILGLDPWFARRLRSTERGDDLDDVAARRGAATAQWLRSTMTLRAAVIALAEHADARLVREREQIDDSNLLARIRPIRAAGSAWIAQASALPTTERQALVELEIDPHALAPRLELHWGTSAADDRRPDRSAEIAAIAADCRSAERDLLQIERRLRANAPAPYR
jgi:hypothetical protein